MSVEQKAGLSSFYLSTARSALERAKVLVAEAEEAPLVYAALELRQAFEALVYENALRFTDELVGEDYRVWQPHQLLERLIEIDPTADATLEMLMQDPSSGEWISLGTDRRLSLNELKKRYHALGNVLHIPTLAQARRRRDRRRGKIAALCNECIELVERDLSANMRIGRLGIFGHVDIPCVECGNTIRRRLNALRTSKNAAPGTKEAIQAKCTNCLASYEVRSDGTDDGLMWREERWSSSCPYKGCGGVHVKWVREVVSGMKSTCPSCGKRAVFTQAYTFLPEPILQAMKDNKDGRR